MTLVLCGMTPSERAQTLLRGEIEDLWGTQSKPLLQALHLLTRDGKLNQDARRKLKQIYHFSRLLLPVLEKVYEEKPNPGIVDMGSGKSYLGFLLYDLWVGPLGRGEILSIESRSELVAQSKALAEATGFKRMQFLESTIGNAIDAPLRGDADLIVALHACDTATDEAILYGLSRNAKAIALVPCCQAEVSRLLKKVPRSDATLGTWQLWRHPLHSREFGSHLTNVIRTLALESLGYKVTVTELLGWEHSMKNELILAEKTEHPNPAARIWLDTLLKDIPVEPMLIRRLTDGHFLKS